MWSCKDPGRSPLSFSTLPSLSLTITFVACHGPEIISQRHHPGKYLVLDDGVQEFAGDTRNAGGKKVRFEAINFESDTFSLKKVIQEISARKDC